jgi:hypothetical protein
MNQAFGVNNTTNDITNSGPVAQQLALHKGATLFANTVFITVNIEPLSMGTIKQAALGTTVVIDFINPDASGIQRYTLNKKSGAANGSVAAALVKELLLKRVGDCALLHFYACQRFIDIGIVQVESDDTSVIGSPALLFDGSNAAKLGGEAILEIRALNVTPGAESVVLFSGENAFV